MFSLAAAAAAGAGTPLLTANFQGNLHGPTGLPLIQPVILLLSGHMISAQDRVPALGCNLASSIKMPAKEYVSLTYAMGLLKSACVNSMIQESGKQDQTRTPVLKIDSHFPTARCLSTAVSAADQVALLHSQICSH